MDVSVGILLRFQRDELFARRNMLLTVKFSASFQFFVVSQTLRQIAFWEEDGGFTQRMKTLLPRCVACKLSRVFSQLYTSFFCARFFCESFAGRFGYGFFELHTCEHVTQYRVFRGKGNDYSVSENFFHPMDGSDSV